MRMGMRMGREGRGEGTDFRGGLVPCFEHPAIGSLAHLFEQIKDLERVHALHHRHVVTQTHVARARTCVCVCVCLCCWDKGEKMKRKSCLLSSSFHHRLHNQHTTRDEEGRNTGDGEVLEGQARHLLQEGQGGGMESAFSLQTLADRRRVSRSRWFLSLLTSLS